MDYFINLEMINLSHDLIALSDTIASFFMINGYGTVLRMDGATARNGTTFASCIPVSSLTRNFRKGRRTTTELLHDRATSQETLKLILSSGFAISKK